eukprot:5296536-Pyramimonas_sp.AAC.1
MAPPRPGSCGLTSGGFSPIYRGCVDDARSLHPPYSRPPARCPSPQDLENISRIGGPRMPARPGRAGALAA